MQHYKYQIRMFSISFTQQTIFPCNAKHSQINLFLIWSLTKASAQLKIVFQSKRNATQTFIMKPFSGKNETELFAIVYLITWEQTFLINFLCEQSNASESEAIDTLQVAGGEQRNLCHRTVSKFCRLMELRLTLQVTWTVKESRLWRES